MPVEYCKPAHYAGMAAQDFARDALILTYAPSMINERVFKQMTDSLATMQGALAELRALMDRDAADAVKLAGTVA